MAAVGLGNRKHENSPFAAIINDKPTAFNHKPPPLKNANRAVFAGLDTARVKLFAVILAACIGKQFAGGKICDISGAFRLFSLG